MAGLAVRVDQITTSPIRHVTDLAERMGGVTRLHAGEPDFNTPDAVIRAAEGALADGFTKYTSALGVLPLRQALADYDAVKLGRRPDPETEVMVTIGGTNGLSLAMFNIVNPGDEVLVPDPGWPPYPEMVRVAGGAPIRYALDPARNFDVDRESLLAALSVRTKALLINSPHNPTGRALSHEDLAFIAQVARERDLWVISDEVYERILFDGRGHESIASHDGMAERTVVVGSFSKTWAMTGWRLGHIVAPAAIIRGGARLQGCFSSCPNAFVQRAGIAALAMPSSEIERMRDEYQSRRDIFIESASDIPGIRCVEPDGTFFIFVDVRGLPLGDTELAERLIRDAKVTCVPGSGFGASGRGFLRFSVVRSPEEITHGLSLVGNAVRNLVSPAHAVRSN